MNDWTGVLPPGVEEFEALAEAAVAALPAPFRAAAAEIAIRIEDFADEATLSAMGFDDPFELTGLYEGVPLTEKSVMDQPAQPDMIRLFRRPILDEWIARGDIELQDMVAHVLVHELAHHFGWSDDQIAAIDRWWE